MYRIGLDVGSTTAKIAVLSGDEVVFSRYERHNAQVKELLLRYFHQIINELGDVEASLCVTGSVGMQASEVLQAPFVQEVVSATSFAKHFYPQTKTLIDIGGEDSKVVFFHSHRTDLRMNGNCSGGTGSFIDQMATLLGKTPMELNELALRRSDAKKVKHLIAARCGVFAKTDVQNLISQNVPLEDIAVSIFHSIAVQTITTLAHGTTIEPPILFCGGPLTFLPALRRAFANYLNISENDYITSEQSNLIPAIGTALQCGETGFHLSEYVERLQRPRTITLSDALPPLFANRQEWEEWRKQKDEAHISLGGMKPQQDIFLGIDSGSTTTKIVAMNPQKEILFQYYVQSMGNPIEAVRKGLLALRSEAEAKGVSLKIIGSCVTGYGEQLIKTAFGLDAGIIETIAHYRAAKHLQPQVSFILDIGGQDMKALFVDKGVIVRMELNEACSSGCGTFLQTFAQSLGHSVEAFAQMACEAQHPCNLGTRCTVFMNSKIKQTLREGATIEDISAGLAYSVVNNCFYKVLKIKDISELGKHIVVQGGTMNNDAIVRAIEKVTGCEVTRSNISALMGAYGCALHASEHAAQPRTIDELVETATFQTQQMQCKGCENNCQIVKYKFSAGGVYYSGNKCERIFNNNDTTAKKGRNIYGEKYALLFGRECPTAPRKIGIPRILNMYENYPFWHRLLTDCGFEVVLSDNSTMRQYEKSLCTVMSDNICFPAKLVHSHIEQLNSMGLERILVPHTVFEKMETTSAINSYNCPIVSGYADVIKSAMNITTPIDAPIINFKDKKLLFKQINAYLRSLKIASKTIRAAFDSALEAQETYEQQIQQRAAEIYEQSRQSGTMTILLAGRPYHTDPLIQHRLSEMIANLDINVISEDIVRNKMQMPDGQTNTIRQWAYMNRIIKAAQFVAQQDNSVQFVQMTSFGCGPDAFILDEIHSLLERYNKSHTILKIDDVTNNGSLKLRVRSLIESLKMKNEYSIENQPFMTTQDVTHHDTGKTIIVPHISEFISPLLTAFGAYLGYNIEVLPPADAQSADIGLKYANNEVCYPATLIVGDIIKSLQSGKYDKENVVIAMSQTGGQCRATNYVGLIKRAMVQAGFGDIPFLPIGVTTHSNTKKQDNGFKIGGFKNIAKLLDVLLYADTIAKLFYATVVREKTKGIAEKLRDKYLTKGAITIINRNFKGLLDEANNAAKEFNANCLDKETKKVGIVGEIFLKFCHFAHYGITDTLIEQGVEVVPPLITPFFLQELVNSANNKKYGLSAKRMPILLIKILSTLVYKREKTFNKAMQSFRYFRPFTNIWHEATLTDGIISPSAQAGEGWLLPAEVLGMAQNGVKNILSFQPFGCIANHIVAKGIENALHRRCPELNILFVDFDSGVSQTNITNRLLLFLNEVEKN